MKPEVRTRPLSQEAAQLLLSSRSRRTLAAFLEARRLSEAAALLGQPLNTVKYHLKRLLEMGLVAATPDDPRQFQAVADSFFIPYEQLPAHWPEELLGLLHQDWEARLAHALVTQAERALNERGLWGVQVVRRSDELVFEHAVWHASWNFTREEAPAVLDLFDTLQLDYQDAKAFQQDLLELISQYRKKGGSQTHLIRVALAPET